jgi:signal transduction histidine kinase
MLVNMKARRNILLIIREVLNNAMKYSRASKIEIQVYTQDKNWILIIADNGTGFDQSQVQTGNGLKNIKDRCAELNGNCTVEVNKGTRYLLVFPLQVISNSGW